MGIYRDWLEIMGYSEGWFLILYDWDLVMEFYRGRKIIICKIRD